MTNDLEDTSNGTRVCCERKNNILISRKDIIQQLGEALLALLIGLPLMGIPEQIVLGESRLELILRELGANFRCLRPKVTSMLP